MRSHRNPIRNSPRRLAIALALLALAGPLATARGESTRAAADSAARPHLVSVKDSPGYVPLFDPESTADVIGHRLNAPLVSLPFEGGARGMDGLGRMICRGLHVNAVDSLRSLCVTDLEFRKILWREFPQSRPALGLNWQDAWIILDGRLHAGCAHAIRDYGGHYYDFMSLTADSVLHCRNFTLYSHVLLTARDDEGTVHHMRWLHGIVERRGQFKIYSTED